MNMRKTFVVIPGGGEPGECETLGAQTPLLQRQQPAL